MVQHRYSFSGADARAFAFFPSSLAHAGSQGDVSSADVFGLESLHTISVSVHEAKRPARALGFKNIKGFARSTRTIAGSMIFTVIQGHPLEALLQHDPLSQQAYMGQGRFPRRSWSIDHSLTGTGSIVDNRREDIKLSTLLSPFNLIGVYVSELDSTERLPPEMQAIRGLPREGVRGANFMLIGVEFLDEGFTTSVNDMVTEFTFTFVARDYREFSRFHFWTPKALLQEALRAEAEYRAIVGEPLRRESERVITLRPEFESTTAGIDAGASFEGLEATLEATLGETRTMIVEESETLDVTVEDP